MNSPQILHEDEYLLAINKPAGMVVNDAENVVDLTVQEWARSYLHLPAASASAQDDFLARCGVVHRLDKDTSGILLIAKNLEVFLALQKQFFERTTEKRYITLVHGAMESTEGTIKAPVGRLPWNRRKFGVLPEGREAITHYRVSATYHDKHERYTLLDVEPKTGRTHQIRIHLKHIGHSVVSDPLYAGRHTLEHDLSFCPRLFLHAAHLRFIHPVEKKEMDITCPLPADLSGAIKNIYG